MWIPFTDARRRGPQLRTNTDNGGSSLMQLRMQRVLSSGRQESKQRTNLFTCARDFIQHARLWKHFSGLLWQEATKQCLLIKTTHAVVYTYSLLCVFISQYSNKVDFISMNEAEMVIKGGQSQWGHGLLPLQGAVIDTDARFSASAHLLRVWANNLKWKVLNSGLVSFWCQRNSPFPTFCSGC